MDKVELEQLAKLPHRQSEVWQGGLIRMPSWITQEAPEPFRPYLPIWAAVRSKQIHMGGLLRPEEQDVSKAVEALLGFAQRQDIGGYRPGRIEVIDDDLACALSGLEQLDVEVRVVDHLGFVEEFLVEMMRHQSGDRPEVPSPLTGQGVTIGRMQGFARAAAAYWESQPWQYLTDVDLIRVETPTVPAGMKYVSILGAGRTVYGLGFFNSLKTYKQFIHGMDATHAEFPGCWQVSFDSPTETPLTDVDLWEDFRLPLADKNAIPAALWFGGGDDIKRPTARRLAFLEGLLQALAESDESEIDSGRWQKEVETYDGPKVYTLALPDLLKPPSPQEWTKRGFTPDERARERMFVDMQRYFEQHPPEDVSEMSEAASRIFAETGITGTDEPAKALARAQELCYQAFDTHGRRRVHLARQALEISPDCADAYAILAEQSGTLESETANFQKAVAAAERVLGPEAFVENVGHFFGIASTRPYMRARFGLAKSLEDGGLVDEAIQHYQDLLRLNPNDNQGVRYLLLPQLLHLGRDREAARLLKEYDEESAVWAYTRVVLAFRLSERKTHAQRELRTARRVNPHVPPLLLEPSPPPAPSRYKPGSVEEALICVEELGPAFAETPGMLDWIAGELELLEREARTRDRERRRAQLKKKKRKGR